MAKKVKFGGKKPSKGNDSFDFGFNVRGARAGGKTGSQVRRQNRKGGRSGS